MRVSELANELGKTSKEVLDIIKQKDSSASLFAASSVSKDQETMVRNAVSQKKREHQRQKQKSRTCKEETDCCFPSAECKAADQAPGTKGAA